MKTATGSRRTLIVANPSLWCATAGAVFKRIAGKWLFVFILSCFLPHGVVAQETFCAEVVIEIKQELTLERQAFDAHMRINNSVEGFPVENVRIDIQFSDENGDPVEASFDPQNTDASFFISENSLEGIDDIAGDGTVAPNSSADIHWLIIPAPGAGGELSTGKLYFVGAKLQYTLNGEERVTEITPDFIYVKPLPSLTLDYFLPKEVYGDDAFTPEIEPPVPFTLGVRVANNGNSPARDLKIDSSQPRIIENELGLLIGFRINNGYVDDEEVKPSLLLDFGSIDAQAAKMGRWQMETTLSGEFIELKAEFSHSDELGGELTSILQEINTHRLVHDVLVDLPGRDSVRDFLADDGSLLRVYESNNVDTLVTNQSGSSSISSTGQQGAQYSYEINIPITAGFLYTQLSDPHGGNKDVIRVIRSDGKVLKKANYWLSKTRDSNNDWNYFVNLFDQNGGGRYTLVMDDFAEVSHTPVLQFIPDRTVAEGRQVGFIVEASDPDGTIPVLTASNVPTGAIFADRGDGVGIFNWTPGFDQAGTYQINFTASDGILQASRLAKIIVTDSETNMVNYEVAFEEGFNIFAYPVQVSPLHSTCLGLLNSLGNAAEVESISHYDTENQQMKECRYGSADDFNIMAGDALVIQMLQAKSLQFNGEQTCPVWFVYPGPNYLGHPAPPENFSCYDLIDSMPTSITTIQSFNMETGRFESCSSSASGEPMGVDFIISATGGLIVNSSRQELVTLPGCQ